MMMCKGMKCTGGGGGRSLTKLMSHPGGELKSALDSFCNRIFLPDF